MDRELLAWAAGFYDGEGSTITYVRTAAGCPIPALTINQASDDGEPAPTLLRFAGAMMGLNPKLYRGRVSPIAHHRPQWTLRVGGFEHSQAALARLWPWLNLPKREQARRVLMDHVIYWNSEYARRVNQGRRSHCPAGHEYTVENTYLSASNRRHCRACARSRRRNARLSTTDVRTQQDDTGETG